MKTSLVLEGGGMRGAYTAGCMSWLIDNGVEFDSAYGVSTGAVHLISYLCKNKDYLYELSTNYIADKKLVGIRSILREGKYVGYDFLFDHILPEVVHYDITPAKENSTDSKIGIYDLDMGKTIFFKVKDIDPKLDLLKASCSLPIIGKVIKYQDRQLLDGGITDMIPIEDSVEDGNDMHLVITTKPGDYVRKPAKPFIIWLMKKCFSKYPKVYEDYKVRHLNYNRQVDTIKKLEKENKAIYMYPSISVPVKRTSGDKENLKVLYDLGYSDMEKRKEEILKVFKK